jgi:hypothetical protein
MRSTPLLWLLAAAVLAALLGGCTTPEISRNIYEGARVYDESLRSTPLEQSGAPLPSFDEYDRERRAPSTPRND